VVELQICREDELPDGLRCQILSIMRCIWPEDFVGEKRLRNWITEKEYEPLHLSLVEQGILISHAEVVRHIVEHLGKTYKICGLTEVFTCPTFRGEGHGKRIVDTATKYVRDSDADIGMFHCDEQVVGFYENAGWTAMRNVMTLVGDRKNPKVSKEVMMAMFLSDKGKNARPDLESEPVYFGKRTW